MVLSQGGMEISPDDTAQSGGWFSLNEGKRSDQMTFSTERRMVLSQGRMEARSDDLQYRAEDGSTSRMGRGKAR
jgi:hypothetical protein